MNKLILLRHGQSQWNLENRFTGWKNVPLTEKGEAEAKKAGELIRKHNISIDRVFSSVLERANRTAEIAIKKAELNNLLENNKIIMTCSEKLNERDYGDLVGLNKQETADKFGKDQVHIWRRSYDTPPHDRLDGLVRVSIVATGIDSNIGINAQPLETFAPININNDVYKSNQISEANDLDETVLENEFTDQGLIEEDKLDQPQVTSAFKKISFENIVKELINNSK